MNDKEAIRAFVLLFILYAFVSTLDFMDAAHEESLFDSEVSHLVPCDTDYECQQLNPHIEPY